MRKACTLCQDWISQKVDEAQFLCPDCWLTLCDQQRHRMGALASFVPELAENSMAQRTIVFAGFPYEGALRQLVRRIKVQDSQYGLQDLLTLWQQCSLLTQWSEWADLALSVPGSLWARLRLKVDLADRLLVSLPVRQRENWPWRFYYRRLVKQSFRRRRQVLSALHRPRFAAIREQFYRELLQRYRKRPLRLLLIDDLLTSGQSLFELLPSHSDIEVRIAVLAYGGNRVKKAGSVEFHARPP